MMKIEDIKIKEEEKDIERVNKNKDAIMIYINENIYNDSDNKFKKIENITRNQNLMNKIFQINDKIDIDIKSRNQIRKTR